MRWGLAALMCGLVVLAGCVNIIIPLSALSPTANAGGPYTGTVGTAVNFSGAASSDPEGETLTYAWNFGDNSTGTGVSPTHSYATPGTYTVSLTVTDSSGFTGSASTKATITAAIPVANAGGPYTGLVGTAVSFSGAASTDPQGETLTYAWNFGDNSTGTGVTPTHTYTTPGTYTVTLTVTDTSGLSGSASTTATIEAPVTVGSTGVVSSGTTPIVGAHVYLLAANMTGYGGAGLAASGSNASLSMLSAAQTGTSDALGAYVVSGSNGGFSITGDYSCAGGQQLYLYALGGNAGSGANAASGLMAAIGSCPSNGSPAIFVTVNEVTTIAAAYAFAGFATDATHVSSSGTALAQTGVANAFSSAANLATLSTGEALATTPFGNGFVPRAEINTLADILASCVNTASSCSSLMSTATADGTATGTQPSDTATAAINIAHHPGANVAALYGMASSTPLYAPEVAGQPNDWTVRVNFFGGGLYWPEMIAIDGSGSVWATNIEGNSVTKLSSTGAILSGATGYTGGGLAAPFGIAIDASGNAWIANQAAGTPTPVPYGVTKLSNSGAILSGANGYTGGGLFGSSGIAIDGTGNAWIADYGNVTHNVVEISSTGSFRSGPSGYTPSNQQTQFNFLPYNIAIDGSGNAWVTNYINKPPLIPVGDLFELSNSGNFLSGTNGFLGADLSAPDGVAIDGSGNVWITYDWRSAYCGVTKFSNMGAILFEANNCTTRGADDYSSIAIDGAGNAWVTNAFGVSVSELSNTGTVLSGANGYTGGGVMNALGIAIDGSGNVWTANGSGNIVNEFIGAATPVITPIAAGLPATPTADGSSKLGTRP